MPTVWRLFAIILLACGWPAGEVRAQNLDTDRFPHLFAPRDQRPRIISIPQSTRPAAPRAAARPAESTRPPRGNDTPASPTEQPTTPTTFVLVLGDNLAEWLAYGLEEAFEDIPELGVADKSRLSSGLARPEFHDWVKSIPEVLAQQAKVDFVVMMVGSNDRQAMRIDGANVEPGTDRWRELYVQRVDAAMQAMKARGVPVYWVGVPPLRGQRVSAHMAQLNEIYKERAQKNGVTYVDVWNGFVDEHGNYTQFGPDFAGQVRRLRTNDGVHFTAAGARKLALFMEQDLRRDLLGRITPAEPQPPVADPGAAPRAPEAALPGGVPLPVPPRPLAGPVLPLAGQPNIPRAAGAEPPPAAPQPARLAGDSPARSLQGTAASVLVRGEMAPPVVGRADDFRWPRDRRETVVTPATAASGGSR